MTVALWLCAIWWGLAYRSSEYGFETWKLIPRSDPVYEYFVSKRDLTQ